MVRKESTMAAESLQFSEKPSRSDVDALTAEERESISEHVKELFDALAPKRPLKPTRSESIDGSGLPEDKWSSEPAEIPEYLRLKDLNATSEPLPSFKGDAVDEDNYTENEYYKDLIAVNKIEHHTTGSGFIKVEKGVDTFHLDEKGAGAKAACSSCKCNPATNDWIPSSDQVFQSSQKPPRSDP